MNDSINRASRAYIALNGYNEALGHRSAPSDEIRGLIIDLFADLHYYASFADVDLSECFEVGLSHYLEETSEDKPINGE